MALLALVACGVAYCAWQRTAEGFIGDENVDFGEPEHVLVKLGRYIAVAWVKITADVSQFKAAMEDLAEQGRAFSQALKGK